MAIVTRTLQQMRQSLARKLGDMEPYGGPGVADSGSTVGWLKDTMLQYYPDDHFNGWEVTALFGTPESRMVTDFTSSSGSVTFAPNMSTVVGTASYELHRKFRKLEYDEALNNAIRSVADTALVDKVDDTLIYRKDLQTYNIPSGFVYINDVQEMDNADGISLRYGMGNNPADLTLGSTGIQNYLRLSQSILTNNQVTYCPAVALLLRNAGGNTTARDMRVAVYSDSSGAPDAALYISEPVSSEVLDEIPRWIRFPFSTQARLAANTRYHLVLYDGQTDTATRYGWLRNQDGAYNSEKVYGYYSTTGVRQIETLTVLGAAVNEGAIKVTVTAAGMPNSPVSVIVDLAAGATASDIGGKIRTALTDNAPDVVNFFTIGGSTTTVQLTAKAAAANDPSMNISIADGSWNGITEVPFSTNTTAGVTPGVQQVETATVVGTITAGTAQVETVPIVLSGSFLGGVAELVVTASGMTNSPVTIDVDTLTTGMTASQIAVAISNYINANAPDVTNFFTVTATIGAGNQAVVFTAKTAAANDATMNIPLEQITGVVRIDSVANSTDTTAGVASGAGTVSIVVTAANMTGSPVTSTDVDVLAGDTATQVASKIAAQLTAENANISNFFTITSSGADVIFTAKTAAANDGTMNIAIDNGTCTGLTPAATSAGTTAGVADAGSGTLQVETTTIVGTAVGSGWLRWTVTAANMAGSPISRQLAVLNGDTARVVAAKLRNSLRPEVGSFFTVSGAEANVILTAKVSAANDATMNMAISNPTYTDITAVASSANTTAGVGAIAGAWTSLSTTTGQSFVVYGYDPKWKSISPKLWEVVRSSTRQLYIDRTLPDGTPLRILGYQAPSAMSTETANCPINIEYVEAYAAAELSAAAIARSDNDPDAWAMKARFWSEQYEKIRGRMKTRLPSNSRVVEVQ